MKRPLALGILVAACIDEFSFQFLPWELQGHWIGITQWLPTAVLCFAVARLGHHKGLSAVCLAVALFKSTTTICSGLWFALRWETGPDHLQCSKVLELPILLVSAIAAILALARWSRYEHSPE